MPEESVEGVSRRPTTAEKAVDRFFRYACKICVSLWFCALIWLAIYANSGMRGEPHVFSMVECWLLGLGCIGVPILPLRLLGNHLNPTACMFIAGCLWSIAALFTVLVASDMLRISTIVSIFVLIIPEALAIHATNAAITLIGQRRSVNSAIAQHCTRHRAHFTKVRERHTAEIAALKESHARQIAELHAGYAARTADLQTGHTEEIARLKSEHDQDLQAAVIRGVAKAVEYGERHVRAVGTLVNGPGTQLKYASDVLLAEIAARAHDLPAQPAGDGTVIHLVARLPDHAETDRRETS